ncbi:pentapeptide repeat-containing protein [Metasolibacillus meyeri]|uniref:Pentapeptide repeat-containing protein n=1 Tax=Metasolibacillus meyeri TaxID=1071052 RepID=A0AAW9NUB9_9BACL|nr:pentapeptide repeat-containing protein [Metasolibacillus meyeri]MEC1180066.1 pentapeptide repeat-containing protein [Metasolibacillus meyeri]
MQTAGILQHFYDIEVPKRRLHYLLALEDFFQANKERLAAQFQQDFQAICQALKQQQIQQQKEPLGHITFSLLRTELLAGRYTSLVEGTNGEWFFDTKPIVTTYDAGWALQFLTQLMTELAQYSQTFMGVISQADIEGIQLREASHFYQYVMSLARYALADIEKCPAFKELGCEPLIEIRIGEFLDNSEVVYATDVSQKDAQEIKGWLEQKVEDDYAYEVFHQLDLSSGNYEQLDARYAFFHQVNLSNSRLTGSALIGASFRDSHLTKADCSFSAIHEADFTGCQLQGVNFEQVQGASGLVDRQQWLIPGYLPVRFTAANLENANFTLADLQGADFQGAHLHKTQFAGANLKGAIFSKESQPMIQLDSFQASQVIWR